METAITFRSDFSICNKPTNASLSESDFADSGRRFGCLLLGSRRIAEVENKKRERLISKHGSCLLFPHPLPPLRPKDPFLLLLPNLGQLRCLLQRDPEADPLVLRTSKKLQLMDIAEKVISLATSGPRTVFILSATGKVATVALTKAPTSSEITIHQGLFDIVSLSGSFMWCEIEGQRCWTGGLYISLAADELVLRGCVAGELTAASPVQLLVRSVTAEGKKDSTKSSKPFEVSIKINPDLVNGDHNQPTHGNPLVQDNPNLMNGDNSQPSHGTTSESSRGLGCLRRSSLTWAKYSKILLMRETIVEEVIDV